MNKILESHKPFLPHNRQLVHREKLRHREAKGPRSWDHKPGTFLGSQSLDLPFMETKGPC